MRWFGGWLIDQSLLQHGWQPKKFVENKDKSKNFKLENLKEDTSDI